jgi:hypothetical protein
MATVQKPGSESGGVPGDIEFRFFFWRGTARQHQRRQHDAKNDYYVHRSVETFGYRAQAFRAPAYKQGMVAGVVAMKVKKNAR